MHTALITLIYAVVGLAIPLCYVGLYRNFFHAFAKIPGPFLAKVTNAYSAYHAARRDTHVVIQRLHEKYGTRFCTSRIESDSFLTGARPCSAIWTRQDSIQQRRFNGR